MTHSQNAQENSSCVSKYQMLCCFLPTADFPSPQPQPLAACLGVLPAPLLQSHSSRSSWFCGQLFRPLRPCSSFVWEHVRVRDDSGPQHQDLQQQWPVSECTQWPQAVAHSSGRDVEGTLCRRAAPMPQPCPWGPAARGYGAAGPGMTEPAAGTAAGRCSTHCTHLLQGYDCNIVCTYTPN